MIWLTIFIPIIATALLLVYFKKHVTLWEATLLVGPSALIILITNFVMVGARTIDTEYWGSYVTKVIYYEPWNEKVSCRHSYKCNCSTDSKGNESCSTCYEHAYDVDYHPEHWTKRNNYGEEFEISEQRFLELQKQFGTKPYFVELNRHYHTIDGDSYCTNWNGQPETSDNITESHMYKNKIKASHSLFKFEEISEQDKKTWKLYDYPNMSGLYQPIVLGKGVDYITDRKLQYINGYYGGEKQFRMYILFYKNASMETAFKQRSYWEGGNKNELVICVGTDNLGQFKWCKCFSWMDKPELEVRVQGWFVDPKNKLIDLNKFADWMPSQIKQYWHRKDFKDFEYLQVEVTPTQLIWMFIIIALYNIGISIWIIKNEFANE